MLIKDIASREFLHLPLNPSWHHFSCWFTEIPTTEETGKEITGGGSRNSWLDERSHIRAVRGGKESLSSPTNHRSCLRRSPKIRTSL
ncbi:unnamed protein product [Arabidopsis thaliana]|uniref:(thale cress) hypothetical protein n=1 Tax=Arabidopsis thaliana TaxID=3702 RepID=A0A7G2EK65_ARATH|nr:unnamed protein product [Arabidopsis thaliana]